MRFAVIPWLAATLMAGQAGGAAGANPAHFIGLERVTNFAESRNADKITLTSPWLAPPRPWNELVVSWNATCPAGRTLTVEARASGGAVTTPYYVMGVWSTNAGPGWRHSVRGQKDALAEVKTDTLICRSLMEKVQVRLTWGTGPANRDSAPDTAANQTDPPAGAVPKEGEVRFLGLCLHDTTAPHTNLSPNRAAWGRTLDVPQRSQLEHAGGSAWCSPASVSMVLAHWATILGRSDLDVSVPAAAARIHDPTWGGTGNWVFNTAFAGHFHGLRAYVTRLADVCEMEDWIAAGIPVVASVSFDLLNGKAKDEGPGHLVVVAGFTASGDVVANDPWPNPKKENSVRRVFLREDFQRAWRRSHQAVYVIRPLSVPPPANRYSHWE